MEHHALHFDRQSIAQTLLQTEDSQPKLKAVSKSKGSKNQISDEESKIRAELEMDIERGLEGEIKGDICQLALRLHQLYQRQKDKQISQTNKHVSPKIKLLKQNMTKNNDTDKKTSVPEINISISIKVMDGETKVDIKEMKKSRIAVPLHVHPKHNNNTKIVISKHSTKKFDWTKSLRSGPPKPSLQVVRNKMEGGRKQHHGRSGVHNKVLRM